MAALVCSGRSRPNDRIRQPEAQRRQHEFQGDDQSDEEGDDTPQDGDHQKRANDGIVIDELLHRPPFAVGRGGAGLRRVGVVEPDVTVAPWRKVTGGNPAVSCVAAVEPVGIIEDTNVLYS